MLMTFAYNVPHDYPKFRDECVREGNTKRCCPIEIWGKPENVVKGIDAHNSVIKKLSTQYKNVLFVDQHKLLPKDEFHFNDICHLTDKGSEELVKNMLDTINQVL